MGILEIYIIGAIFGFLVYRFANYHRRNISVEELRKYGLDDEEAEELKALNSFRMDLVMTLIWTLLWFILIPIIVIGVFSINRP